MARANLERLGLPVGAQLPGLAELTGDRSGEELLDELRSGDEDWPVPFASLERPSVTARYVADQWPEAARQTVRRARRIVAGKFDLLGYEGLCFGQPINWHRDPVAGREAPVVHWSQVPYLNREEVGDAKVIWELNRHQWLVTLGRAFRMTGNERFAEAYVKYIDHWMENNPPRMGINWTSSLEVALRSVAWVWALHLFRDSPRVTASLLVKKLRFLTAHGRHIESYLSTHHSPNTHLTGEALGLVYLGTFIPCLPEAEKWQRTGLAILKNELGRQIHSDGVYFEQTTWYHRYTIEIYLHLYLICERHDLGNEKEFELPLRKLFTHLMWMLGPDRSVPMFGDDDGGRVLFLDERPPNDFSVTLASGAALFGEERWAYVAGKGSEEIIWLMGREAFVKYDNLDPRPPQKTERDFPDGGFFVVQDGWEEQTDSLIFRCPASSPSKGHCHADALTFVFSKEGEPFLIDSGTGSYSELVVRNQYRKAGSHNALTLAGISSSAPDCKQPFKWKTWADCTLERKIYSSRFWFVRGRHNGFRKQGLDVEHTRSIFFLKGDYCLVHDRLCGASDLSPILHYQFAPATTLQQRDSHVIEATRPGADGENRELTLAAYGIQKFSTKTGTVAPLYGFEQPAPMAKAVGVPGTNVSMSTLLLPSQVDIQPKQVNADRAEWALEGAGSRDGLTIADKLSTFETEELSSDFDLVWTRRCGASRDLREVVLYNGRWLALKGKTVIRSSGAAIPWITVNRHNSGAVEVCAAAGSRFVLCLPSFVEGEDVKIEMPESEAVIVEDGNVSIR